MGSIATPIGLWNPLYGKVTAMAPGRPKRFQLAGLFDGLAYRPSLVYQNMFIHAGDAVVAMQLKESSPDKVSTRFCQV